MVAADRLSHGCQWGCQGNGPRQFRPSMETRAVGSLGNLFLREAAVAGHVEPLLLHMARLRGQGSHPSHKVATGHCPRTLSGRQDGVQGRVPTPRELSQLLLSG